MAIMSVLIFVRLLFVLALFVGVVFLQIYLSKRESKWPGLVLPGICFLWSLIYPLNMIAPSDVWDVAFVVSLLLVWAIGNFPTFLFLVIYFFQRKRLKQEVELDRMRVHDLDSL